MAKIHQIWLSAQVSQTLSVALASTACHLSW